MNRIASLVTGRMSNNTLVHFKGDVSLIGTLQNVYLDECRGFYYMGTPVEPTDPTRTVFQTTKIPDFRLHCFYGRISRYPRFLFLSSKHLEFSRTAAL